MEIEEESDSGNASEENDEEEEEAGDEDKDAASDEDENDSDDDKKHSDNDDSDDDDSDDDDNSDSDDDDLTQHNTFTKIVQEKGSVSSKSQMAKDGFEIAPKTKVVKLDPLELALGEEMIKSSKRRREIIEMSYNR